MIHLSAQSNTRQRIQTFEQGCRAAPARGENEDERALAQVTGLAHWLVDAERVTASGECKNDKNLLQVWHYSTTNT